MNTTPSRTVVRMHLSIRKKTYVCQNDSNRRCHVGPQASGKVGGAPLLLPRRLLCGLLGALFCALTALFFDRAETLRASGLERRAVGAHELDEGHALRAGPRRVPRDLDVLA